MNNKTIFACAVLWLVLGCGAALGAVLPVRDDGAVNGLVSAYPDAAVHFETRENAEYLRIDGALLLFRPAAGCPEPDPDSPVDQPLCASLLQKYPQGAGGREPEQGMNPGRVRNEALLKLLYGQSADAARGNLVAVPFLGQRVLFNTRHGAAAALERVGRRLEPLVAAQPELREYLFPLGGAFAWRTVAGTQRLSPHSFGIALDVNVKKGAYWRWNKRGDAVVRHAQEHFPQPVVDAFEAEGFIWGGKWRAFDYMHFEYRPELLRYR